VLGIDARLPAADTRFSPPPLQLFQDFLHCAAPSLHLPNGSNMISPRKKLAGTS
jgi:hypothetical protein